MRVFAALFLSAFPLGVCAQTTNNQALTRSYDLIQEGRSNNAVIILTNLANSPTTTPTDRGRAETLLGLALKEQGRLKAAGQAFDAALRLLDNPAQPTSDYASTLDYYAGLELLKGNSDLSRKLLDQAAALATQLGNHAQLSSVRLHVADLEIRKQHYHEARAALEDARAEFRWAGDSGRKLAPDLYGTSGWLASLTHRAHQAVTDYTAALDACTHLYGAHHMLSGWAHMLLGRAQASDHDLPAGLASMQSGLAILKETIGTNNQRYLVSELAYSSLLDDAGSHAESIRISTAANKTLSSLPTECPGCTASIWELQHR